MSIDVTGGAGGVGASYQDLLSEAGVLDAAGEALRTRSDDVGKLAVDGAVLASALLCPGTAARVELALGAAAIGPRGLLPTGVGLQGSALILRATVETYQVIDGAQKSLFDAITSAEGFALGASLPFLAVGAVGIAVMNPGLTLAVGMFVAHDPDGAAGLATTALFNNPWLMREVIALAPGMVQGLASDLPGGMTTATLLSGGHWPTGSYEDSIAGLVSAGNIFGAFKDSGTFRAVEVDGSDGSAPTSVAGIFDQQWVLGKEGNEGEIQIVSVGPKEHKSYIVQIPGTQVWSPTRGDNPVDLTTNLELMSGRSTVLQAQVVRAMHEAGIPRDAPVMLTGHSQGGITCAAMASDSQVRSQFNVTAIVTGGSPIARFDIPDNVSVLSLEHEQDAVPMLDGRENPDRPNWVTVKSDATDAIERTASLQGNPPVISPVAAHGTAVYSLTAAMVDTSSDPSLVAWRERASGFLTGDAVVERYKIESVAP